MIEFISGIMTGGLFGILLMCLLQIYRDNEAQKRIDKAIEYIKEHLTDKGRFLMLNEWQVPDLLKILGGGADD